VRADAETPEPDLSNGGENALMLANQRLQVQIDRAEAWAAAQEERQRQAEEAAKARCEQLLLENQALSEEVRSLRESVSGSPDLTETPEPPVGLPSGVLPGSPGAGNFLDAMSRQVALKKGLTKAFGKERAEMIRARSEAVADLYFGDA
jgi:hypothetical protein